MVVAAAAAASSTTASSSKADEFSLKNYNDLPQVYFEKLSEGGVGSFESIDQLQQSITITLQKIDKNFSDCNKAALLFYNQLSSYHRIQLDLSKSLQKWTSFFELFSPNYNLPRQPAIFFQKIESLEQPSFHLEEENSAVSPSTIISPSEAHLKTPSTAFQKPSLSTWTPAISSTPTLPSSNEITRLREDWDRESMTPNSMSFSSEPSWLVTSSKRLNALSIHSSGEQSNTQSMTDFSEFSSFEDEDSLQLHHQSPKRAISTISTSFRSPLSSSSVISGDNDMNRAHFDQETSDTDDINSSPKFNITVFPQIFQTGLGAQQLSEIYNILHDSGMSLSLSNLEEQFPQYDRMAIQLILDMLARKKFIRANKNTGYNSNQATTWSVI